MQGESSISTSPPKPSSSRQDDQGDSHESITVGTSNDDENQGIARHESIRIHDLSFILHPAHEASTSEKNTSPNSTSDSVEQGKSTVTARASYALGVAPDALETM